MNNVHLGARAVFVGGFHLRTDYSASSVGITSLFQQFRRKAGKKTELSFFTYSKILKEHEVNEWIYTDF